MSYSIKQLEMATILIFRLNLFRDFIPTLSENDKYWYKISSPRYKLVQIPITNSYRRGTNKMTGVIFCFVNSSETIPTHTLGELGNTVQFKYVL